VPKVEEKTAGKWRFCRFVQLYANEFLNRGLLEFSR
jgi:hypothetical protein